MLFEIGSFFFDIVEVAGLEAKFDLPKDEEGKELPSTLVSFQGLGVPPLIKFLQNHDGMIAVYLRECDLTRLFADDGAVEYLKSLASASIDNELSLTSREHLSMMLEFFSRQLNTNKDFELTQAFMSRCVICCIVPIRACLLTH